MRTVSAIELAGILQSESTEWALLDVRETYEADQGHILGASFLPRRMIEIRVRDLVPSYSTRLIVYGDAGKRATYAAETLERAGYSDVEVLGGGISAWAKAGFPVVPGSNVPSKVFGESLYERRHVPSITAKELSKWQRDGRAHIVCDIRTPEEYKESRIPGAYGAFGVDLALVAADLRERAVPVVVHCSGRTRSIIACQTLREFGVTQAVALENGTMGWRLAGHDLEDGAPRGVLLPSPRSADEGEQRAQALATNEGVVEIKPEELDEKLRQRREGTRNLYMFDVRQVPDYLAGHLEGATALPGGLAIQRIDEFAPVQHAPIVLVDESGARAWLTGLWLRRMGWRHVYVLAGGVRAWRASGRPVVPGRGRSEPLGFAKTREHVSYLSGAELHAGLSKYSVVDVDTSRQFGRAHVPAAHWIPYGWLEERMAAQSPSGERRLVLTCRNGIYSTFGARNLMRCGYTDVLVLQDGVDAWSRAGLPTESGWPQTEPPPQDLAVPPYHSSLAEMAKYLEWERALLSGLHGGQFSPRNSHLVKGSSH